MLCLPQQRAGTPEVYRSCARNRYRSRPDLRHLDERSPDPGREPRSSCLTRALIGADESFIGLGRLLRQGAIPIAKNTEQPLFEPFEQRLSARLCSSENWDRAQDRAAVGSESCRTQLPRRRAAVRDAVKCWRWRKTLASMAYTRHSIIS